MKEWFLFLQITMTSPHSGDAFITSQLGFETKAICEHQADELRPNLGSLIRSLFGVSVRYKNESLTCKEIKQGTPA